MGYEEIPQPPVIKVTDDWTGKEIAADTKPLNVTIDGQRLALYLGPDTKAEVQDLIKRLQTAGSKSKASKSSGSRSHYVSDKERAQRKVEREAYAKAHGKDPNTMRWNQSVRDWYTQEHQAKAS